jgi:dipeptidase E
VSSNSNLLLLSSSAVFGRARLEHARAALAELLGTVRRVHFAAYAMADHDAYTTGIQEALAPLGIEVVGLHTVTDARQELDRSDVLFVGGGNTFRLLHHLQRLGLIEPVRRRVMSGELRYIGASAGTNVACPTIRTTNDMPIVEPTSFEAFGLVPFQINPHYQDPLPDSTHMGETREERIIQFLEENEVPVLGMREGAWLRRRGAALQLEGLSGARVFERGQLPRELQPGTDLSWLLDAPARFDSPA